MPKHAAWRGTSAPPHPVAASWLFFDEDSFHELAGDPSDGPGELVEGILVEKKKPGRRYRATAALVPRHAACLGIAARRRRVRARPPNSSSPRLLAESPMSVSTSEGETGEGGALTTPTLFRRYSLELCRQSSRSRDTLKLMKSGCIWYWILDASVRSFEALELTSKIATRTSGRA
jgi:hypothetical protein